MTKAGDKVVCERWYATKLVCLWVGAQFLRDKDQCAKDACAKAMCETLPSDKDVL